MDDDQSEIKNYYEEWWENPRDPRDIIFKKLNEEVLKRVPQGRNKRALDIGAGKGTIVSYLHQKGYRVTAVELNENFVANLREKFPDTQLIEGEFNSVLINETFDIISAIEFIQNLDREALGKFIHKVARLTDHLVLSVSNKNSLHGLWAVSRGFKKNFVHVYAPGEIERMLQDVGFKIAYKKGIGLITPITLLSNFRLKLIPIWLTKVINSVGDRLFPKLCHLYYLEAKK